MKHCKFVASTVLAATALASPTVALALGPATAPDTTPAGAAEFCTSYLALLDEFESDAGPDVDAATALLAEMGANPPADVADSVAILVEGATAELGGDDSATSTPEFLDAYTQLSAWAFDNCEFDAAIDVAAVDWAFGGIPLEVPAGRVAFRLTNLGTEYHEMGILRRLDGATQSWEEMAPGVMTEEESAMEQVEWVGHAWSPNGDTTGFAFVNLEPGEYAAICFMPIGSTQDMTEDEVFARAGPGLRRPLAARNAARVHGGRRGLTADAAARCGGPGCDPDPPLRRTASTVTLRASERPHI